MKPKRERSTVPHPRSDVKQWRSQLVGVVGCLLMALAAGAFAPARVAHAQTAVLDVSVVDTPDPVGAGGRLGYIVTTFNRGAVARDIQVTLAYPASTTFATSLTAPDAGTTTQWTFASVPAGSSRQVVVEVLVGAGVSNGTVLSMVATATDLTFGGSIARTTTTTVQAGASTAPLEVSVADTPDPVGAGGRLAYTLTTFNRGAVARDVVLTLTYAASTTFATSTVPPDAGTTTQWTLHNVAANGSSQIAVEVTVGVGVASGTLLSMTATATDATFGGSGTRVTTTTVQAGAPTAPLDVSVLDVPDPAGPGGRLGYTVSLFNRGAVARDVVLTMAYAAGTSFSTATSPPDSGSTTQWTFSGVPAGSSRQIAIEVAVGTGIPSGTTLSATSTATDVSSGGSVSRITTTNVVTGAPTAPLDLSVLDTPDPVEPGARVSYTIIVQNRGAAARGLVLTLGYDPSTTFATATLAPDAGTTTQWTFSSVAPNSSKQLSIEVTVGAVVPDGTLLGASLLLTDATFGGAITRTSTTTVRWCAGVPNGTACIDGLFCNGADSCSGGTCSVHSGNPCVGGGECADSCDEVADSCFDPSGTACQSDGSPCTVDACDGAGGCAHTPGNAGVVCRAAAGVCDVAEACDGVQPSCPADAFASATLVCRAAAGACDVADTCTGNGASCPADALASSSTVCRPAAGACDVAELCSGSNTSCPADALVPAATMCRASAGACDVAEACTGTSAACPGDAFASSSTVCRPSGGACDVAEACSGTGAACPTDVLAAAGTTCRASAGPCDVAEACSGDGATCPVDGFRPSTTICRATAGECDVAETCTGNAASCPVDAFAAAATVCRVAAGACDLAEACSGASAACPIDELAPAAMVCRPASAACDLPESCSGSDAACPADAFAPTTTVCRAAAGVCDVAETCTGSGGDCPVDGYLPSSSVCRVVAGDCDVAESCTGSGPECPADAFAPATIACRAVAGDCDVPESCTGSSAACPSDRFVAASTVCRAASDACDVAESCSGSDASCPGDAYAVAGTLCRAAAGACDVDETCTGTRASCPADAHQPPSTVCRAAAGECDLAESCSGSSADCPADALFSAVTVCRVANGPCDRAELCTGDAAACPADLFAAPGVGCSDDGLICTADACDGAGACTHPPGNGGTVCRAAGDSCDLAEVCDGVSAECPEDGGLPDLDADGLCDAQDVCTNVGGAQNFESSPVPKIVLGKIHLDAIAGNDKLALQGAFALPVGSTFAGLTPAVSGARVELLDGAGSVVLDAKLPGVAFAGRGTRGWRSNRAGTKWEYVDKTADGSASSSFGGIVQVLLIDRSKKSPRELLVKVQGKNGTYDVAPGDVPVAAIVVLGTQTDAAAGLCGEVAFQAAECGFNGLGTALKCQRGQ